MASVAREERASDRAHAGAQVARPGDSELPAPPGSQHGVHEQERHPAAVITVQVREQDGVDAVVIDPLLLQGDQ